MTFLQSIRKTKNNEYYQAQNIKNTLIELLFFILFLVVVSIITLDMSGAGMFYMSSMIKKLLIERTFSADGDVEITFQEICLIDDYWRYVDNVFMEGIYGDSKKSSPDNCSNVKTEKLSLLSENILIGPPRLKQLKVRNDSCVIDDLFKRNFRECFGAYQHSIEDINPFGLRNGTAWTYRSSDELEDMFLYGNLHFYAGGGFHLDMSSNYCESRSQIDELQENEWITRGTRLVLIEFSLYNINENIFGIVKLIAEIPATGGIITSFSIRTLKLVTFVNAQNYFVMFCYIVFLLMVCWYMIVELLELYTESWSYFKSLWNIVDMLIILISVGSFAFAIYRFKYIKKKFDAYMKTPNKHISLDVLAFWEEQYKNFIAICVFLVWIKIFKYISFNKTMLQFCITLKRCANDLLGFGFMFFVAFIAYAQLGYILFGTENENFRTFRDSLFTLLRTILGDFDYLAIEQANRILGPIYFITYVFIMFFVLLNMFLAIINDTYSEVKDENVSSDVDIASYIKAKWNEIFMRKGKTKIRESIGANREETTPIHMKQEETTPINIDREESSSNNTVNRDETSSNNPVTRQKSSSNNPVTRQKSSVNEVCSPEINSAVASKKSVLFEDVFRCIDDDTITTLFNGLNDRIASLEDTIEEIAGQFELILEMYKTSKERQ